MNEKIRYLHINLDNIEMIVKNTKPTIEELEEVDNGYLTIIKVVDDEFMEINPQGNFDSIKKNFTDE